MTAKVAVETWRVGVPFELVRDPSISANAKVIYAAIRSHAPNAYPAINTLAGYMGVSRSTAIRALAEIEDAGWIRRTYRATKNGQETNLYTCLDKPRKRRSPGVTGDTPPMS